jgi:23S rRNA G2069 N7-methylase RlmK/C1962 C5-methylase RlmI
MSDAPLTTEDYQSVVDAGRILEERGWRRAYTVNEQVEAWQRLVESVEDGYPLTIDDYTNDLAVRQWLHLARSLLTDRVRQSLDRRLASLDERFTHATVGPRQRMPGAGLRWWYRVPKVLVGELREDVDRLHLLES